jgi:4-hydroxy-tetrahydrodipicolinate reductase
MKIGVPGCTGRVGALIVEELLSGRWNGLELAGGTTRRPESLEVDYFVTAQAEELFTRSDVIIDFTTPEAGRTHIELAEAQGKPLILATTGFSAQDEQNIKAAAQKAPIVYAANTSIAVTMLDALVEQAARALGPEFDIEIIEAHHKHKVDAPSGTALMLGKSAAKARGQDFKNAAVLSREGHTGARKDGEIGFSTIRGGDIVGEHTVYFIGEGERLELKQQATNRALYAKGALRAALWVKDQPPGLYSMRDVLGL